MRTPFFCRRSSFFFVVAPVLAACGGGVESADKTPDDAGITLLQLPDTGKTGTPDQGTVEMKTHPVEAGAPDVHDAATAAQLTAVTLYSCTPSEYTASVTIGKTQTFQMAIDTGSTTLGVASTSCTSCAVTPEYMPGGTAVDQDMTGTSQYGTGSWSGEIYEDDVAVGTTPAAPVDLVAIDTQSDFFEGIQCDSKSGSQQGILGLGPSASALPGTNAFFDQFVATYDVPNVFATELCDTTGTLWLGGFDPAATTAAPQYTPLAGGVISTYYYSVDFESIAVNGTTVPVASADYADSVVDTGTSIFILPTTTFDAVTQAIASSPAFQELFGGGATVVDAGADGGSTPADGGAAAAAAAQWFSSPDNCVHLTQTKAELDAMLPPMTLIFGGSPGIEVAAAPTESYMISYEGMWCPTLYAMSPGPDFPVASIMGSPVLRSNVVIFDRDNQRIGFAPHTPCP